jgi:2,5-diamino-6-(ribosylamino)-4(3H)-pyrimidinone 5'-phosphate reductase
MVKQILLSGAVQVFITEEQRVDLEVALQYLKQAGVQRLLVEGGGTLNEQLLKHDLVDEISVYIAPLIFGGENAPTFAGGVGFNRETATPLQITNIEKHPGGGIETIRNQII